MGIAHLGEVEARSAARSAVQQFNGAPYAELHNRLTWKWLAAGSAMRAQVDRFIEGSSRAGGVAEVDAERDRTAAIHAADRVEHRGA